MGKYGRLLGWLYIGDAELSLNEQMIAEGYAWEYDGGTKQKTLKICNPSRSWNTCMIGFYLTVSVVLLLVAYAGVEETTRLFVTLIFNLDILLLKYAWSSCAEN